MQAHHSGTHMLTHTHMQAYTQRCMCTHRGTQGTWSYTQAHRHTHTRTQAHTKEWSRACLVLFLVSEDSGVTRTRGTELGSPNLAGVFLMLWIMLCYYVDNHLMLCGVISAESSEPSSQFHGIVYHGLLQSCRLMVNVTSLSLSQLPAPK